MNGRRIKLIVSYDGTEFHGWQVQPGLPTIQGLLEQVIGEIESEPVKVEGSGRTDAGVHAIAQVAAVTIANPIPTDNLRRAINRLLPPAVRVTRCDEVAAEFHPRFDATAKTYEYRIWRAEVCPPFLWRYVHHHPYPLDEAAMRAAAKWFEGEHDFTGLASTDDSDALGRSKVRTVFASTLTRDGEELIYRVRGSGFLKHMVRNLTGTLIEVGKGNLDEAGVRDLLASGDRRLAGPTVPAKGLCLISVEYADQGDRAGQDEGGGEQGGAAEVN